MGVLKRYYRYCMYMFEWIFLEKIRGLDFSMRVRKYSDKDGSKYNGYSKTDEHHIKEIFSKLSITAGDRILDIGCGKGVILKELSRYPFSFIAGLEYNDELAKICEKNMRILKLSDRVKVFSCDASEYKDYCKYNYFYFFNSFTGPLLDKVLDKIESEVESGYFIYHNPTEAFRIDNRKGFKRIMELRDNVKNYDTYVYSIINTER